MTDEWQIRLDKARLQYERAQEEYENELAEYEALCGYEARETYEEEHS